MSDLVLVVVIRDETPLRLMNEPVTHRSIRIELTDEQCRRIRLRDTDEAISMVFLEDK